MVTSIRFRLSSTTDAFTLAAQMGFCTPSPRRTASLRGLSVRSASQPMAAQLQLQFLVRQRSRATYCTSRYVTCTGTHRCSAIGAMVQCLQSWLECSCAHSKLLRMYACARELVYSDIARAIACLPQNRIFVAPSLRLCAALQASNGALYQLNATTGAQIWNSSVFNMSSAASVITSGNVLFVATLSGRSVEHLRAHTVKLCTFLCPAQSHRTESAEQCGCLDVHSDRQ